MSKNNNNILMIAGLGLLGYQLLNQHTTIDGIAGISNTRKSLYRKFLYNLGFGDEDVSDKAYQQMLSRWNKMSIQQIIMDAYRNDILLVSDNYEVRMDLSKRYARATGQEWPQHKLNADFSKKTLQQLLAIVNKVESEYFNDDPA